MLLILYLSEAYVYFCLLLYILEYKTSDNLFVVPMLSVVPSFRLFIGVGLECYLVNEEDKEDEEST